MCNLLNLAILNCVFRILKPQSQTLAFGTTQSLSQSPVPNLTVEFMKYVRLVVFGLMSTFHEWFSVAGTLSYHDSMLMEKEEKGTMLEDTYEDKGMRWSSGKNKKKHWVTREDQGSRPHEGSIWFTTLWRVDKKNKEYLSWIWSISHLLLKTKQQQRVAWHCYVIMKSMSSMSCHVTNHHVPHCFWIM